MSSRSDVPKPGILTLVTIVSFLWSALNVLRVIAYGFLALVVGAASWLLGPAVGTLGTLAGAVVVILMVAQSILSILLFSAAWHTMHGDPRGRSQHKTWAWINLVLDGLDLILTGGLSPASWWGVAYAIGLLFVMDLPEVRAYFDRASFVPPPKPGGYLDDSM
jgi:hypothetical protein